MRRSRVLKVTQRRLLKFCLLNSKFLALPTLAGKLSFRGNVESPMRKLHTIRQGDVSHSLA